MAEKHAAAITPTTKPTAHDDRRVNLRKAPEREFTIRLLAHPHFECLTAVIGDVSTTGLGLVMDRSLEAATVLSIQFPGQRNRRKSSLLSAVVKHSAFLKDNKWRIGCKLSMPLREAEKQTLLKSGTTSVEIAGPVSQPGRRAWVRYGKMVGDLQKEYQNQRELGLCTGRLRDINNESLRLTLKRHLKVGSILATDLGDSNKTSDKFVQARVVDIAAHKGEWVIGCQFTNKLSDEELQTLLAG